MTSSEKRCVVCGGPLPEGIRCKYSKIGYEFEGTGVNGPVEGILVVMLTNPAGGYMCHDCADKALIWNAYYIENMTKEERESIKRVENEQ